MPAIDEETAIGLNVNTSSLRQRRKKPKAAGNNAQFKKKRLILDQIDSLDSTKDDGHEIAHESDVSIHSHSDRSSDERSNSSMYTFNIAFYCKSTIFSQYEEEKNRRGRLTSLLMGVSRQTLGSSKQSLNSRLSRKRSSTSKL